MYYSLDFTDRAPNESYILGQLTDYEEDTFIVDFLQVDTVFNALTMDEENIVTVAVDLNKARIAGIG